MSVNSILQTKGFSIPIVQSNSNVRDVLQRLEEEDVGALVVSDDGESLLGIISERDIVRGLRLTGDDVLDADVSEIMTRDVITCNLHDQVALVRTMMVQHRIRHIPVLDQGKLKGFLSIRDVIQHRLDEVQAEADVMQGYISGRF